VLAKGEHERAIAMQHWSLTLALTLTLNADADAER
jgi:hypothetical protein